MTNYPLLPMASRSNYSFAPASGITLSATTTYAEVLVHVTGLTTASQSMHIVIERSLDGGSTWHTMFDSGVVQGPVTNDKTGVVGDILIGFAKNLQSWEVGPGVRWRPKLTQVGTFSFDANATTTP